MGRLGLNCRLLSLLLVAGWKATATEIAICYLQWKAAFEVEKERKKERVVWSF